MKKIIFVMMLIVSLSTFAETDPIVAVFNKYNCLTCHNISMKIVGPSFKDIAAKYQGIPSAENMLVKKVSVGGVGTWGNIPMPANDPNELHQPDIHRLVQYILKATN